MNCLTQTESALMIDEKQSDQKLTETGGLCWRLRLLQAVEGLTVGELEAG
jgi:hypothetical protein